MLYLNANNYLENFCTYAVYPDSFCTSAILN